MGDTFGQIVRSVRLRVPMAPALLVESWVQDVFREAWEYRRPGWSFARFESGFAVQPQKMGTVSVTFGSAFVQGVGLTVAATDEGRQFRGGVNQPVYTIECADVTLNRLELDRPYLGETNASIVGRILDAYVTMPLDFGRFIVVLDPKNFWQLRHWITEEQLNAWDPQRTATTTPWALVSRRLASTSLYAGRIQYELWPFATGFHEYWYFYYKRPPELLEDDPFPGIFADRGSIIRKGALREAAEWPGTEDRKNPYFNLQLASKLRDEFTLELARLEVSDEDIYPSWWEKIKHVDKDYFTPIDARYLQSHDFQ